MAKYQKFKLTLVDLTTGKWDRRLSQRAVHNLIETTLGTGRLLPIGDGKRAKNRLHFDPLPSIPELAERSGELKIGYIKDLTITRGKDGLVDQVVAHIRVSKAWLANNSNPKVGYCLKWKWVAEVSGCIIKRIYGIDLRYRKVKVSKVIHTK